MVDFLGDNLPLAESGNGDDSPPTADELIRNCMKLSDRNRMIHLLFDISVIGKAVDGLLEIAGGFLLFFMIPSNSTGWCGSYLDVYICRFARIGLLLPTGTQR